MRLIQVRVIAQIGAGIARCVGMPNFSFPTNAAHTKMAGTRRQVRSRPRGLATYSR